MEAQFPTKTNRYAQEGDSLILGQFLSPGSPAPHREPYWAFCTAEEPDRVSLIRDGDMLQFRTARHPQFHGRRVRIDTGVHDVRSMRQRLPTYAVFVDTAERVLIEEFPQEPDFVWILQK